jgi:hypothetical protein
MKIIIATDDGIVYDTVEVNDDLLKNDDSGMYTTDIELGFWEAVKGYIKWTVQSGE